MSDRPDQVITVVPKNKTESIRVALRTYNGHHLADLRVIVPRDGEEPILTTKGVSIPIRRLAAIIDALKSALGEAQRQKLFEKDAA